MDICAAFKCATKSFQVPESRVAIVRLLEAVRLERGTGPLLVHCLDGATRSGLFAVCHLLTERVTRDHYVDMFHVIKAIKLRRRAVVSSQVREIKTNLPFS